VSVEPLERPEELPQPMLRIPPLWRCAYHLRTDKLHQRSLGRRIQLVLI